MRRSLAALVSIASLLGGTAVPAAAAYVTDGGGGTSEGVATDACREVVPEDRDGESAGWAKVTGQACDTVRVGTWNAADACWTGLREVSTDGQELACEPLFGQQVSSAQVDEFEGSWVELAHRDQHAWGNALPMRDRTVVATHNSYNALTYDWAFSRMDANQTYSMVDQLRMGVRRLELDVHWFFDTTSPDPRARRPVLCHAQNQGGGNPITENIGCSVEFTLADGLAEISDWLDANTDQFVMLRLEDHLKVREAYDDAAADLEDALEGHLYRPVDAGKAGCTAFDAGLTAADVLATGTHVMIISDCKAGAGDAWNRIVWDDRGSRWEATYKASHRDAFRAGRCPTPGDAGAHEPGYATRNWVRFYNDATWLSATASRSILPGSLPVDATAADAAAWMRCGVNQPAFDFLTPTDGRMEAMVWSWAPEQNLRTGDGRCAVLAADGRFHSEDCAWAPSARAQDIARGKPFRGAHPGHVTRPYLCATTGGWAVTTAAGSHAGGDAACATEFPGSTFAFPRTAVQAAAANDARDAAGASSVWLALTWDTEAGWA